MALEALSPARRVVVLGHGPLAQEICARLPGVAEPARRKRLERTLTAGDVDCVLAVGPDHEDNLRAAIHASRTAPGVPVIIRAFDPKLADEIERDRDGRLNVRGAFSVAHLAAPAFVAGALLHDDEQSRLTLRLGEHHVTVCSLVVRTGDHGFAGPRARPAVREARVPVAGAPRAGGSVATSR